jgi:hypothetical protein
MSTNLKMLRRFESIGPVQQGIPVAPKPSGHKPSEIRVAMEELEPGESRIFSGYESRKLIQTAATLRKVHGWRYSVRATGDSVVRVWRLA